MNERRLTNMGLNYHHYARRSWARKDILLHAIYRIQKTYFTHIQLEPQRLVTGRLGGKIRGSQGKQSGIEIGSIVR